MYAYTIVMTTPPPSNPNDPTQQVNMNDPAVTQAVQSTPPVTPNQFEDQATAPTPEKKSKAPFIVGTIIGVVIIILLLVLTINVLKDDTVDETPTTTTSTELTTTTKKSTTTTTSTSTTTTTEPETTTTVPETTTTALP